MQSGFIRLFTSHRRFTVNPHRKLYTNCCLYLLSEPNAKPTTKYRQRKNPLCFTLDFQQSCWFWLEEYSYYKLFVTIILALQRYARKKGNIFMFQKANWISDVSTSALTNYRGAILPLQPTWLLSIRRASASQNSLIEVNFRNSL